MTEREFIRAAALAFEREDIVQETLMADEAGHCRPGEVQRECVAAVEYWQRLELHIKEKHRLARKRLLKVRSPRAAA